MYHFHTKEFAASDHGIHLLRSGFNYKTIPYSEIRSVKIERDKLLHNWFAVFFIGTLLLIAGTYLAIQVLSILLTAELAPRNAYLIFLLLVPCTGGYFIFQSFQTGIMLKIYYGINKKDKFPLNDLIQKKELILVYSLLKTKLDHRFID